nr:zinc finger, CCHC-type [Tanacetum cinerariifolium]
MITPYELWTKKKPNLNYLRVWSYRAVVRLPYPKMKTLGERGIECIFVRCVEHSKAFSPKTRIPNETEYIGGSVVPEEVVQQPEPELRKSKRNRTPKNFGPEFQLYLIEETRDEVFDQHSYCFNVEDDPKIFDEAMKDRLLDTYAPVARISTIRVLIAMASIHNLVIHHMDVKTAFLNGDLDEEVDMTKDFLSSRFSMKDMREADVILCIRIKHEMGKLSRYTSNPGTQHWQAIQRVLKYLKKTMNYKLTYTGYPFVLEDYTDASLISNSKDNSSMSGWVFLLGGGAISWASKKQTCITGSTMEFEFMALAAAGKEAEWLKNMIIEILLWSKLIEPISIRCDSAATLANAYSQMYNGKSRHLGIRHSMIREMITNEVISIEFVRSQQNLADHLMMGLARDLVIKSAEEMRLKSS